MILIEGRRDIFSAIVVVLLLISVTGSINEGPIAVDSITTDPVGNQSSDGFEVSNQQVDPQRIIDGVPAYFSMSGCVPTSIAMVLGYHDVHGFPGLFDGEATSSSPSVPDEIFSNNHADEYEYPYDHSRDNILIDSSGGPGGWPNPDPYRHSDNCLADFLKTSQSAHNNYYGSTEKTDIIPGIESFVSWIAPYYDVSAQWNYWSELPVFSLWDRFRAEIDANRPVILSVDAGGTNQETPIYDGKGDHSVAAIGYGQELGSGEDLYCCYDTWDDEPHWYHFKQAAVGQSFGIDSALFVRMGTSYGDLIRVDDVFGEGVDNPPEDFTSVQQAIDAANPGDLIYVHSGTYHENIFIYKSNLYLIGEDRKSTVLIGTTVEPTVFMYADHSRLSRFTIQGDGDGIYLLDSRYSILFQNIVMSTHGNGIFGLGPTPKRHICYNTIEQNRVSVAAGCGIKLQYASYNDIVDNEIISNGDIGLSLWGYCLDNIIGHNIIKWNGGPGINLGGYGKWNKIKYNKIFENIDCGILLEWYTSDNIIVKNRIQDNFDYGIKVDNAYSNYIQDCTISGHDRAGIYLFYSDGNEISKNHLINNIEGIAILFADELTIKDNIFSNGINGITGQWTSDSIVQGNQVEEMKYNAIALYWQVTCYDILYNFINNVGCGILFGEETYDNYIFNNIIHGIGGTGIKLGVESNYVIENVVSNSHSGIFAAHGNCIFSNNFLFNEIQAGCDGPNVWDDGNGRGNFWSDYSGLDDGSNGRIPGDGIGDTEIPHLGLDLYPEIREYPVYGYTPSGEYISPFLGPMIGLEFETVITPGLTVYTMDDSAVDVTDGFDIIPPVFDITTTATHVGNIRIRIYYDEALVDGDEDDLALLHFNEETGAIEDITDFVNTIEDYIEGISGTLSSLAIVLRPNKPPIADAGDDIILFNGETVHLDGSESTDPDGSIVSFQWDFGDNTPPASGKTVDHVYMNHGTYIVTLTVTDDDGDTGTDTLVVTVLTPTEAIELLADIMNAMGLPDGIENSLDKKLENAQKSLEKGNINAAINQLEAFVNEVEAQRGKKITEEQADILAGYAQWINENTVI